MRPSIIFPLLLAACAPAGQRGEEGHWQELPLRHARCFSILQQDGQRRLLVFASPERRDTLADLRCGARTAPIQRLAALSTTHLAFLRALGLERRIVAAAFIDRARDTALIARWRGGEVHEVATADGIDRERLASARVDAVLDYPFGRSRLRAAGSAGAFIPVVEYLEEHPLGRAEWIRFFGVLLDREALSDTLFAAIEERYAEAIESAKAVGPRPRVFFGSAWQGQWHAPPGGSYMARLISDAGGEYALAAAEGAANIGLSLERVYVEISASDRCGVLLAHGGSVRAQDMTGDPRLAALDAVRLGGFYLDSERSDVFGQALLEPDALLRELACVFRDRDCPCEGHRYVLRPAQ
jgi:iron complex transport system substrate-binding protein